MRSVLDGLIGRLHPDLPGSALGEILDRLMWITDDNGSDLVAVCREGLDGDDVRKVEAALSITEGFLFEDPDELKRRLDAVAARWPSVSARASEILDDRRTAHSKHNE